MTGEISETLTGSGFPGLRQFYLMDLKDGQIAVILRHGQALSSLMLLDAKNANLGILMGVAIPGAIKGVDAALKG